MAKEWRYHLGLDWGTSTTKMVLRDYENQNAFVLMFGTQADSYRYPSTVAIKEGRIYFGLKAESCRGKRGVYQFNALKTKMDLSGKIFSSGEFGFSAEDLATLYLAHVISLGLDHAEKHARQADAKALMTLTVGIPSVELEKSCLRQTYLRMVRTAYFLATKTGLNPQGIHLAEAFSLLAHKKDELFFSAKDSNYHQWLRPELAAAMYWGLKSPRIQADLYSCVDIGAWTINVSYFRIHQKEGDPKGAISFFGGACQEKGLIGLLHAVAQEEGLEFNELFGVEATYLSAPKHKERVETFSKEALEVCQNGFAKAFEKQKSQGAWDGLLNMMVVGGGAKIHQVRQLLGKQFPGFGCRNWSPPSLLPKLGVPRDLYYFPDSGVLPTQSFDGDYHFLLVAYGLSVDSFSFPQTTLAPQVSNFKPEQRTRTFLTSSDLGYDEK